MVQQKKAPAAKPDNLTWIFGSHTVKTENRQLPVALRLPHITVAHWNLHTCGYMQTCVHTRAHAGSIYTHNKQANITEIINSANIRI